MKLTDEMRAAIASIWVGVDGARSMQTAAEQTILAGYRMGQQAMRERAAKECEAADERAYPFACAAMIRALSTEE